MQEFIKNFADQWDETELEVFTPECEFRELEEWSSLTGLAELNMIARKYNVKITPAEFRACDTVQDVFNLVQNKKA